MIKPPRARMIIQILKHWNTVHPKETTPSKELEIEEPLGSERNADNHREYTLR